MTHRADLDEGTLALVRRADPLATARDDDADPDAALRAVTRQIDALESRHNQDHRGAGERRVSRLRPRVLAGSTLGLAGIGAALVLALGTSATSPAFAVTQHSDGTVFVQVNRQQDIAQANQKLTAMRINEQITLYLLPGPATGGGPVNCTPAPGAGAPNPPVQVEVGTNGTRSSQSAGNSGSGSTDHLACLVGPTTYSGPYPGNTVNAG
jgi:hypothetical protein